MIPCRVKPVHKHKTSQLCQISIGSLLVVLTRTRTASSEGGRRSVNLHSKIIGKLGPPPSPAGSGDFNRSSISASASNHPIPDVVRCPASYHISTPHSFSPSPSRRPTADDKRIIRLLVCRLLLNSMRRRSSGSAEEDDDTDEAIATESPYVENNGLRRSFTSAKYDVTRHSDTLDRRKVEKTIAAAQVLPDSWKLPPGTQGTQKKQPPLAPEQSVNKMVELRARRSRTRSPWSSSLLTLSATALSMVLLLCIIHAFATRQLDFKGCDMYYTRSIFFKFADFDTEHTRFASKYSLHLYREGGFDEDSKAKRSPLPCRCYQLTINRSRVFLYYSYLAMLEATSKQDPLLPSLLNTSTTAFSMIQRL
jgi:hypothetical protein